MGDTASFPLSAQGRLASQTRELETPGSLGVVAQPSHPFAYIEHSVYSTRFGRLEPQGSIDWNRLGGFPGALAAGFSMALNPAGPVLGVARTETRSSISESDLVLDFVRVDGESGRPEYESAVRQSLGRFPYCLGTLSFSWSGRYAWLRRSDCYKGSSALRLAFSSSLLSVLPGFDLGFSGSELQGIAPTRDDRHAFVGTASGTWLVYLMDVLPGERAARTLSILPAQGAPGAARASPGSDYVLASVDGTRLELFQILPSGLARRLDTLRLAEGARARQIVFASADLACVRTDRGLMVVRIAGSTMEVTDGLTMSDVTDVAVAAY